jgi:3-hydroxyacyl-CoA dehydrogenase
MGGGIAEAFAAAGLDVRVTDATPELAREARDRVVARTRGHVDAGLLPQHALERAGAVEAADGPAEAVESADLVLEAVAEDTGVKLEVHAAIEAAAPEDAVIATNTSSLDVYRAVAEQHRDAYGERFSIPEALQRLVDRGDRGTASGAGFYAYDDPESLQSERDRRYAALDELQSNLPPQRFDQRQ